MCQYIPHSNHYCSSYNAKGTVAKKIFILNKNIVHLIDDIFWHLGFKTETQAEKVIIIIHIILFISLMTLMTLVTLILIIRIIIRCVKIFVLQITCGRTKGLLLPKQLMPWAISFALPCAPGGFPTSVRPTRTTPPLLPARPSGTARWWSLIESIVLLLPTYTNPVWWRMPVALFFQWIPGRIATSCFVIMMIIYEISEIIVS